MEITMLRVMIERYPEMTIGELALYIRSMQWK